MPDIQTVVRLSRIFKISLDEFVYGEAADEFEPRKLAALELKKKAERFIMTAIGIFVVSAFGYVNLPFSENMNLLIFGIIMTIGILIIVQGGFYYEKFYLQNREYLKETVSIEKTPERKQANKRKNAVGTVVTLSCVIVYLLLSFLYGLWHPAWLIFLLIPISYALYDLVAKES